MIVCEECLQAIESHEGGQRSIAAKYADCESEYGYINDDGNFIKEMEMPEDEYHYVEEYIFCEWCEEWHPIAECYEI